MTTLADAEAHPSGDILRAYRMRWEIKLHAPQTATRFRGPRRPFLLDCDFSRIPYPPPIICNPRSPHAR